MRPGKRLLVIFRIEKFDVPQSTENLLAFDERWVYNGLFERVCKLLFERSSTVHVRSSEEKMLKKTPDYLLVIQACSS